MPFGCLFKKENPSTMSDKDRRAKLGLKVVMAQQNPEPVYDLSDCAMLELPPDTFVMCRLLQKTVLLLQDNSLTSFEKGGKLHELEGLEVLDLTNNKFAHLPDSVNKLKNLRILKLGNNKLKTLPVSISELTKLKELYLSSNKLSKVPVCICALPTLQVLSLIGNNISVLPKEFCKLQKSLHKLEIDTDKLQSPPAAVVAEGTEAIMRYLCEEHGIAYEGICEAKDDLTECASPHAYSRMESSAGDQALRNYMCRKDEKVKAQLAAEEEFQAKEQQQLAHMLQDMSNNKQHLLAGIFETPVEAMEYERKKLKAMQEQYNIEENVRAEQAEQLEKYLASSNNKESLIYDITTQQANMDLEMEGLVTAKEKDRQSLLKDLATTEQETAAAVQELVNSTASRRSDEFLCLLQDQETEMQSLLSGIVEAASELRHSEVVAAMKAVLVEEAAAEQRRLAVQEEQGARVCALLEEADLVDSHLKGVLTSRLADQEEWASTLLKDEECQAAAFRLLLLKSDLQRNNILRQIGQIEYELYRLSSMEVRKRKHGIKYGSSTMLEQRATLVDLLKSLLMEKSEREAQLMAWIAQLEESRTSDVAEEEFWLVQYQRLLSMKPAGLAEAEAQLEPKVREILSAANAMDLSPVFAQYSVTFSALMDMTEEDASGMGIGPATYRSLQRALQNHLAASKLENQTPSAPVEEDLPFAPSAPEMADEKEAPSAPVEEGGETAATAPPVEGQFVEAECVICLNSICEVVFLPCGHVCACAKCCTPLLICPMCRSPIINKILLTY
ncbi:E3 ubiquitin-protein ligase LRSAM1 [Procambarus clarkii]|uniref:E3 ubiquitin-protein ligase LRSAM1 n=1 Tax=Procambarus clarkii TaxID=6728 RepID=UPI001E673636|nr:E3 ubiquitin-protein ligase LRSAM1-like [Procambarus clarkii]XP_045622757.1 E3 ubiquitin-protein ligase LRSAM1-like [Procambarus clarkii]XP_045622758.1 E3 ubiquitin-protein ligase LRSAM1-like [Procambarus clarkii]XP_045622759.1 E3 ubiquitin-protein ligase LRSAM1-like [Procambarus clarkii]